MAKTKVVGICGSLREGSWNRKLLENFLPYLDADTFSVKSFPSLELPLLNQDLEGQPLDPRITAFRAAIEEAAVVVIASPEYNGSFSGALKNAIDWASRPPANLWNGKIVLLLSASPGALGGMRGILHLKPLLSNCRSWVIHDHVFCGQADKAFDSEGRLVHEGTKKQMAAAAESLRAFAAKMA